MHSLSAILILLLSLPPQKPVAHHSAVIRGMKKEQLTEMAHHVPQEDSIRLEQLRRSFKDAHCEGDDLREQSAGPARNLECVLPGASTDTILFVAHYERTGAGMSAVENWSGAIMLPFLYYAMTASPRQHTFTFLELDGEAGARAYLHSLSREQLHRVKAVVALDALGLGHLSFYQRPNTDPPSLWERQLREKLIAGAQERGLAIPEQEIPGGWLKVDDTQQFRYRGVASILVHSVNHAVHGLPGTEKDTAEAINGDAYFDDYAALCFFMIQLDALEHGDTVESPQSVSRGRRR